MSTSRRKRSLQLVKYEGALHPKGPWKIASKSARWAAVRKCLWFRDVSARTAGGP